MSEPQDFKDIFDIPAMRNERIDPAYVRKTLQEGDEQPKRDGKEFFHVTAGLRSALAACDVRARIPADHSVWSFVDTCVAALEQVERHLVSSAYDDVWPGEFAHHVREAVEWGSVVLRLLAYDEPKPGQENLGKMHTDKDAFTVHAPLGGGQGLRCLVNGEWVQIPLTRDEVLVFPGFQMEQATHGVVRALEHGVPTSALDCSPVLKGTQRRVTTAVFVHIPSWPAAKS